jgi:3'-phosphoadenosine 5'-phosphosulfate (PAPS) 3'-phosphatase
MESIGNMARLGRHGFPRNIQSVSEIIALAKEIGQELRTRQAAIVAVNNDPSRSTNEVWVRQKEDGTSFTAGDVWANNTLEQRLRQLAPSEKIGIVTEESDKPANLEAARKSIVWMVDPLDNTGDYKRGGDDWSVTIGCMEKGIPKGGVVHYPNRGRTFYTGDDGTAYMIDDSGHLTRLAGTKQKKSRDILNGRLPLNVIVSDDAVAHPIQIPGYDALNPTYQIASHVDRYWAVTMSTEQGAQSNLPAGSDMAEHGEYFYAWDVAAPAAIGARTGVGYFDRSGRPLEYLIKRPGHNDFELPKAGFIAGNEQTMKNLGLLPPTKRLRRGKV